MAQMLSARPLPDAVVREALTYWKFAGDTLDWAAGAIARDPVCAHLLAVRAPQLAVTDFSRVPVVAASLALAAAPAADHDVPHFAQVLELAAAGWAASALVAALVPSWHGDRASLLATAPRLTPPR